MKQQSTGWIREMIELLGITEEETAQLTDCEERAEICFQGEHFAMPVELKINQKENIKNDD